MNKQELKRIAIFSSLGAIGFGIGAIGFGAIRIRGWDVNILSSGSVPSLLGFPTMGAIGGAALGLALWNWRKAVVLALVGAVAFSIGFLGGFFGLFVLYQSGLRGEAIYNIIYGGIPGLFGGAALGLASLDLLKIVSLAIAGAIGFGAGMLIMANSSFDPMSSWGITPFKPWLGWVLWGVIGGGFLGVTLGYIECKRPSASDDSD
jgi:hypothetical protein